MKQRNKFKWKKMFFHQNLKKNLKFTKFIFIKIKLVINKGKIGLNELKKNRT